MSVATHKSIQENDLRYTRQNRLLAGLCRMLPTRHTRRAELWRAVNVFSLVLLLALAAQVTAQPGQTPAKPPRLKDLPAADGVLPLTAPLVDRSHVEQAHRLAEQWVRQGRVVPAQAKRIPASGVVSVRATLRWLGKTMGSAQIDADRFDDEHVSDVAAMTALAVRGALRQTEDELQQRQRIAEQRQPADVRDVDPDRPVAPVPNNPADLLTLKRIAPLLLVDLQVAHSLATVHVPPGDDELAVMDRVAFGYHGLRMSLGNGSGAIGRSRHAWAWPGNMLAANVQPHSQLVSLLSDIGMRNDRLKTVGRAGGPTLQRFDVIHVVRPTRDQPRTQLVRGNVPLPAAPFTGADVEGLAHHLARHLIRRVHATDGSMTGTYHPTSDRFEPEAAPTWEVALAAYALGRYADVFAGEGLNTNAVLLFDAKQAMQRATRFVLLQLRDPTRRPDAAATSLALLTLVESSAMVQNKPDRDVLIASLLARQSPDGAFLGGVAPNAPPLNVQTQSLVLAALSAAFEQTRDPRVGQAVDRGRTWLWKQMNAVRLLESLPWLPAAELRLHRVAPPDPTDKEATKQWNVKADAIRSLAAAMRSRQVSVPPQVGPPDVVGGFDLTEQSVDKPPQPHWQSSEGLMLLTMSLHPPLLTDPADRVSRLLDCGLAARFLAQLMMDDPSCYYARSPADARGGVRELFWNNELRVEPTAKTLLAVTELRAALDAMR